jgi:hypothetical protein
MHLLIQKKCEEMIEYIHVMCRQFPRYEKYILASKIRQLSFDIYELIIVINKKFHKKTTFTELNVKHELLRQMINLAFKLRYIDSQKHRVSQLKVSEVGRLLGDWISKELSINLNS